MASDHLPPSGVANGKHRVILPVAWPLVARILSHGTRAAEVATDPLPEGTRLVDIRMNPWRGDEIELLLEHPSFPFTLDGGEYLRISGPTFRQVTP